MSTNDRSKKWIEFDATSVFLKSKGIADLSDLAPHQKYLNTDPDEPSDIEYKNWKFQVTNTAHGEDVGRVYRGESRGGVLPVQIHKIIDEYILIPVQNKIDSYYGTGVGDTTLLIYDIIDPFALSDFEEQINEFITSNLMEFLESAGFKDIYIVFGPPPRRQGP